MCPPTRAKYFPKIAALPASAPGDQASAHRLLTRNRRGTEAERDCFVTSLLGRGDI